MSKRKSESSDAILARLEEEHRMLKMRVAELSRRAILTPAEQQEAADLKKRKLAKKDRIEELRRLVG
jgi:uncharacterized protein YdcH (DUF465 family)